MLEEWLADWTRDGIRYWLLWSPDRVVGAGGVRVHRDAVWNLYYRLEPAARGRGLARWLAQAGREAAGRRPELPLVARIREENAASLRVARAIGLVEVGRDRDGRAVLADRPVAPEVLTRL